jgi:hypothetical protein
MKRDEWGKIGMGWMWKRRRNGWMRIGRFVLVMIGGD